MTTMRIWQLRLIEKGAGDDFLVLCAQPLLLFLHLLIKHIPSCMGGVYHGVSLWPSFCMIYFYHSFGVLGVLLSNFECYSARVGV